MRPAARSVAPPRRAGGLAAYNPGLLRHHTPPVLAAALLVLAACTPPAPPAPTTPPAAPTPTRAAVSSALGASVPPLPTPVLVEGKIPTADPAAHVFLWGNHATTERDLRLARDGGFTWVKQRFEWRNIEKNGKGQFEWHEPDRIVDAIAAEGLKIVARVDNQPRWASSRVAFPASGPPDDLRDWTDFLTALVSRYRGRIAVYEVWNEPNLAREWGEQKPDAAAYVRLLRASYQAIKAADPQALVATAGLSPTTEISDRAVRDMDYLRDMYAAGLRGSYDLLGAHAAGYKADPCADPAIVAADPDLTNGDPSPVETRRIYAFRHVEDVRRVMVEQGDADKQIAILEMGWTTDRRPDSPYRWHAVTEQQQALNLVGAFRCARERWGPWAAMMTVIYIADPSWAPTVEQYWWSITNPNGSPRPAYTALKGVLRP